MLEECWKGHATHKLAQQSDIYFRQLRVLNGTVILTPTLLFPSTAVSKQVFTFWFSRTAPKGHVAVCLTMAKLSFGGLTKAEFHLIHGQKMNYSIQAFQKKRQDVNPIITPNIFLSCRDGLPEETADIPEINCMKGISSCQKQESIYER